MSPPLSKPCREDVRQKTPTYVELEEQILLNYLTVRRLSSLFFFFSSFASKQKSAVMRLKGCAQKKILADAQEKILYACRQPFCSLKACSHIFFQPSHVVIITVRCSRGDCMDYSGGSRDAASSGEGRDAPGTQQQQQQRRKHVLISRFPSPI